MSKRGDEELHYFGVNLDIVWNIIEEFLPGIAIQIEKILADRNR